MLSHAAALHGIFAPCDGVDQARLALSRLGLVEKGDERDRRPSQDEVDAIIGALEANVRQKIPVGRIIRFTIATAMRQDEIARVEWDDPGLLTLGCRDDAGNQMNRRSVARVRLVIACPAARNSLILAKKFSI